LCFQKFLGQLKSFKNQKKMSNPSFREFMLKKIQLDQERISKNQKLIDNRGFQITTVDYSLDTLWKSYQSVTAAHTTEINNSDYRMAQIPTQESALEISTLPERTGTIDPALTSTPRNPIGPESIRLATQESEAFPVEKPESLVSPRVLSNSGKEVSLPLPDYKLKDTDIGALLETFTKYNYRGGLNISGHDFSDHTVISLCTILEQSHLEITNLNISNNGRVGEKGFITLGAA
jgi:hypothetical protein